MKDYIEERAVSIANYIIDNNATVRQTAKTFGVSKSTVHKDVTERLMQVNPTLAMEIVSGSGHGMGLAADAFYRHLRDRRSPESSHEKEPLVPNGP